MARDYSNTMILKNLEVYNKLEIDSPQETYDVMAKYAKLIKGVKGLTCEIGLRRAGGTITILESLLENNDYRTHVCVDPYGNITYNDIMGSHKSDYTNTMKNETLSELYKYANDKNLNIIFFNLEDNEFYKRFSDGVPVYEETKKIINTYSFVHIDGQHEYNAVRIAAEFFVSRITEKGFIIFDNTNHYDHYLIHKLLIDNEFILVENILHKLVYRFK